MFFLTGISVWLMNKTQGMETDYLYSVCVKNFTGEGLRRDRALQLSAESLLACSEWMYATVCSVSGSSVGWLTIFETCLNVLHLTLLPCASVSLLAQPAVFPWFFLQAVYLLLLLQIHMLMAKPTGLWGSAFKEEEEGLVRPLCFGMWSKTKVGFPLRQ